jgi:SAM-dependent methyltransferase
MRAAGSIHTPRYLLRRGIVLQALRRYEPGYFLEIGCGRGELLPWLSRLGHHGVGLEISPTAWEVAAAEASRNAPGVRVVSDDATLIGEQFDYVLALEVLEHIEDDHAALRKWREWLAPDGRLILSVPAHMAMWSAADVVGGHFRRYERVALQKVLEDAGLQVEVFWSYGFPVTAVTGRLRNLLYAKRHREILDTTREERTLRSSFDSTRRSAYGGSAAATAVEIVGSALHLLQLPFRNTDLGDGYLVVCRKTA